jgi:hypothetical protein
MALGELTRQLAQQAISGQVQEVVDALRPPDLSKISESLPSDKAAAAQGEPVGQTIIGQLQAMQKALKEDEELVALFTAGLDTLRVLEIYIPSWRVIVLTGIDAQMLVTRVLSPV